MRGCRNVSNWRKRARSAGEGPSARSWYAGGKLIATGANGVTAQNDPTAHAEVQAIRAACTALGDYRLNGCELYASTEPCPMCLAASYWARVDAIYYAATRSDAALAGFDDSLIYDEIALAEGDRSIPFRRVLGSRGVPPSTFGATTQGDNTINQHVAARLSLEGITKRYPAVVANDGVSLEVAPGEIHAVLGENGAGKSTLMKIIYGAVRPDEGVIRWNGWPVNVKNPEEARALGIAMVFQHFSLFDTLSVAENVWLGVSKSVTLAKVVERIREVAAIYGLDLDPLRPVHTLSVGERQRVEIVRALLANPQLLILDEPTSVLTPSAVEKLFVTLRKLADGGCSILYISHKLDEIRALCHRCTVLRGGKVTGVVTPSEETNASLSRHMIGSEPPRLSRNEPIQSWSEVALAITRLSLPKRSPVRR